VEITGNQEVFTKWNPKNWFSSGFHHGNPLNSLTNLELSNDLSSSRWKSARPGLIIDSLGKRVKIGQLMVVSPCLLMNIPICCLSIWGSSIKMALTLDDLGAGFHWNPLDVHLRIRDDATSHSIFTFCKPRLW
jgi:hypothetical protein